MSFDPMRQCGNPGCGRWLHLRATECPNCVARANHAKRATETTTPGLWGRPGDSKHYKK